MNIRDDQAPVPAIDGAPLQGEFRTLGEVMAAAATQFGDQPAFEMSNESAPMTYAQWYDRSARLATHLQNVGVERGDVVVTLLPSGYDYAVAVGACVLAGAVATGINDRLGRYEIASIIDQTKPKVVLGGEGLDLPDVPRIGGDALRAAVQGPAITGPVPGQPSDLAVIVWTSGTTGTPKGACWDHASLAAVARSSGPASAPFERRAYPNNWAMAAFMLKLWDQTAFGITTIGMAERWSAQAYRDLIKARQVNFVVGVPTQWEKLLELPEDPDAYQHVRLGLTSSAPISPTVVREVADRLGFRLLCRYAMTESFGTGTGPDDDPDTVAHTVGRPLEGVELRLNDGTGHSVAPGSVGTVQIRTAAQMRGYWGDPERTASVLDADGWLTTGDIGRLDEAGNLVLVGRRTELYIRGGYNVYPREVELVLEEHPGVDEVVVAGFPAPKIGEKGVAFVVPAASWTEPSVTELQAWCTERIADYKRPDDIIFVSDLPRTSAMKIDRAALTDIYESSNG